MLPVVFNKTIVQKRQETGIQVRPVSFTGYPDGRVTDDELTETLLLSCELRQRVREQLHLIAPGEYDRLKLGVRIAATDQEVAPVLPDADRVQKVALPVAPSIGEVIGFAVDGDHGCILHFEMQATKGSGRIVPLGSIQKVMQPVQVLTQIHEDKNILMQ